MEIYSNNNNNNKKTMRKIHNLLQGNNLIHNQIHKISYYINNCHKVKFSNCKNNKRISSPLNTILLKRVFMKKVGALIDNILLFLPLLQK